jgi:hypothetical protein
MLDQSWPYRGPVEKRITTTTMGKHLKFNINPPRQSIPGTRAYYALRIPLKAIVQEKLLGNASDHAVESKTARQRFVSSPKIRARSFEINLYAV